MKNILTFFLLVGSVVAFGFDGLVKTTRNAHTATVQSAALHFVYSGEDSHLAALDKAKEAHPNNQELKEALNLAISVVGIVTPYDEFYLLGRALQLAKTTYRVARFSAAKLLAKNRKLKVAIDAKGAKLLEDAGTKLDDLVAFEKLANAGNDFVEASELAEKLNKAPTLKRYFSRIVDQSEIEKVTQLKKLLDNIDANDIEKLISKLDDSHIDNFLADISADLKLARKLVDNEGLVDSWKVIENNPILRKKPENLENISKWLDEGIEPQKLTDGIAKSKSKQNLLDELGTAESKLHARVLIKNYDNIPGVVKGRYTPNGSTLADKTDLPNGWASNLDLDTDAMSTFTGRVEPLELKTGDKIYRVSDEYRGSGAYWTKTKPNGLEDVVGGTAVRPEWNNFEYLYEYTIPDGITIKSWQGKAARQRVSDIGNNYHLPGGDEQLLIPFIKDQDASFADKVIKTKAKW